ncbi:MAG: SGNH/GDSL hydrolase family protein [Bacteroidetes bacterium]|nr:MAG: SGNH/GDSL hydrolase family protein [Bacteroidota bacterium]
MQLLRITLPILLIGCLFGCPQTPDPSPEPSPNPADTLAQTTDTLTYLALGDSYTIGQSVPVEERWPVQLADSLRAAGFAVADPLIIARTGWSTAQLLDSLDRAALTDTFSLVSLLIGVNNQFRSQPESLYVDEFAVLLQRAIARAGGREDRVFVLSIPDYGVTPFGQIFDPEEIAEELDRYNAIADSICQERNVVFFDITPISREAADQPELIADDNLHPSGLMYTRWVTLIRPGVVDLLTP